MEEEAREYVNSVHIEDDPVDKYSLPEQQEQQDFENEIVVEEAPVEESPPSFQSAMSIVQDPPATTLEEPVEEPPKKTYASIVCPNTLLLHVVFLVLSVFLHLCSLQSLKLLVNSIHVM